MSLTISDSDLQIISLEYIQYPDLRTVAAQGLALTIGSSDNFLELDGGNKEFTDYYRDIINKYSLEKNTLNLSGLTLPPSESLIVAGAQKDETLFPATPPNVWVNLPPLLLDSNNGIPAIPYSGVNEPDEIVDTELAIDNIINGIAGTGSSDLESPYTAGDGLVQVENCTVFNVGDFIFVSNFGDTLFAEVTAINKVPNCTGSPQEDETDSFTCTSNGGTWDATTVGDLVLDVIQEPTGTLPAGTLVETDIAGFTNEEREESDSLTPTRAAQLQIFKDIVDSRVQALADFYSVSILPVIEDNPDLKEKTNIENNIASVNSVDSRITTWQSFPNANPMGTGTESRFGDIEINKLSAELLARKNYIPTRSAQITSALGSVAQDSVGLLSGTGRFFDFAEWQNKRINSATGTLSKYYNSLIAIEVQQQVIFDLDSNHAEQDIYFRIEPLLFNGTDSDTILVSDTAGFDISDTVKVLAEGQTVLTGSVIGKTATAIQLDITVSSAYTLDAVARIVKQNS